MNLAGRKIVQGGFAIPGVYDLQYTEKSSVKFKNNNENVTELKFKSIYKYKDSPTRTRLSTALGTIIIWLVGPFC